MSNGPSVDDNGIPSGILMSHHSPDYALVFCHTLKGYKVLQCTFPLFLRRYNTVKNFFGDDTILLKLFYIKGDSLSYDLWLGGWPKSRRASHLSLRTKFALTDDRDDVPAGNEKEALYFLTFSTAVNLVVVTVLGFLPPHPPFLLRSLWRYIAILYVLA